MIPGIKSKWECPSCGYELKVLGPLIPCKGGLMFDSPSRCGCGRVSGFKIITFEKVNLVEEMKPKSTEKKKSVVKSTPLQAKKEKKVAKKRKKGDKK